jgi:Chalcone isomerase-like
MKDNAPTRRRLSTFFVGAFLLAAPLIQPAAARELEGVRFPERYQSGDAAMRLTCVALLRYKILFKAYVAALYLGDGIEPADVLGDVPKRLELSYFWGISGPKFGEAGDEILAQNIDPQMLARLRPRLDKLNALYEDVRPGDRYSLTYVPGVGTELALNDRPLGVIDGADFGSAYFRIWLGDHPLDTRLRDQLLGCSDRDGEDRRAASSKR